MGIKVLLVDRLALVGQGLAGILKGFPEVQAVALAGDACSALQAARREEPQVLITDYELPDMTGLALIKELHERLPGLGSLIWADSCGLDEVQQALAAGVHCCLNKSCSVEILHEALRKTLAGESFHSFQMGGRPRLAGGPPDPAGQSNLRKLLTPREVEILTLLAEAKTTKEIALNLKLSLSTVYAHRQKIYDKLGESNLVNLTKLAWQGGLVRM